MSQPAPAATPPLTSRRALLRAGGLGAVGAAFLAACGDREDPPVGVSGAPLTTTTTPAQVPTTEPSDAALEQDTTLLRTATSLELAVAGAYADQAGKIDDPELQAAAQRFGEAHEAAADVFADATPAEARVSEPNEYVQTEVIDPVADGLSGTREVQRFLGQLESMLTATYADAAGVFTAPEMRQRAMTHGAASARRAAALLGTAAAPTAGLYPTDDLIPNAAYLSVGGAEGEEGADAAEGQAEGDGSAP